MAPGMSDRTDEEYDAIVNISASKRAAVDAAWAALARRGDADGGGPGAGSTSRSSASTASTAAASKGRAALSVLAKLNRTNAGGVKKGGDGGAKKKKLGSDGAGGMRALGVDANAANANANANAKATNGRGGKGTGKSKVSAAALEAAKSALDAAAGGVRVRAASRTDGVVTVSETRVFAGKARAVVRVRVLSPLASDSDSDSAAAAARRRRRRPSSDESNHLARPRHPSPVHVNRR